jgi:broad specificity phosphatase PhoE
VFRLTLVAAAPSRDGGSASFPGEGEGGALEADVVRGVRELIGDVGESTAAWCGPEPRVVATAAALGIDATPAAELAAWSAGAWAGRPVEQVAREQPESFARWRTDPNFAPTGGQSLAALIARVARWLDACDAGRAVVVADATVVRSAVVHALAAPVETSWHVDVAPLTVARLQRAHGTWRLQALDPAQSPVRRRSR